MIFLQGLFFSRKKSPSLLPFLLLEHLCCGGREPQEKPRSWCSQPEPSPRSRGGDGANAAKHGSAIVYLFSCSFQKNSLSKVTFFFLSLFLPWQREGRVCLYLTMLGVWDIVGSPSILNWSSTFSTGSWLREGGKGASCGVSWGLRSACVGEDLKGQDCVLLKTHYGKIMPQTQWLEEWRGLAL